MTASEKDIDRLASALLPIIEQALGMKTRADHGTVVHLTADEINAGKAALEATGRWPYRMWEEPRLPDPAAYTGGPLII
jgi:hypothetical protein